MFSDFDLGRLDPARYTIDWAAIVHAAIFAVGAILLAFAFHRLVFAIAGRLAARTETQVDEMVVDQLRGPMRWKTTFDSIEWSTGGASSSRARTSR